ncbi:hypothetical protein CLF_111951 [Clonorchis sinensis]|uniref:Uncharacterized protein n=1 Tax=Clonorchis sinensis TaxID=79923 RepID=G7YVL1_CLOSI|nr:hypothetical protein CLF_111951 [Clonorchis sinensis]
MRRPGAAHSVAWKHQKREIQLGSRLKKPGRIPALVLALCGVAARHQTGITAERFIDYLAENPSVASQMLQLVLILRKQFRNLRQLTLHQMRNLVLYCYRTMSVYLNEALSGNGAEGDSLQPTSELLPPSPPSQRNFHLSPDDKNDNEKLAGGFRMGQNAVDHKSDEQTCARDRYCQVADHPRNPDTRVSLCLQVKINRKGFVFEETTNRMRIEPDEHIVPSAFGCYEDNRFDVLQNFSLQCILQVSIGDSGYAKILINLYATCRHSIENIPARLSKETETKLRESGQMLYMKLSEVVQKINMKVKDCVGKWLAKDNLGEKLAEVLEIRARTLKEKNEKKLRFQRQCFNHSVAGFDDGDDDDNTFVDDGERVCEAFAKSFPQERYINMFVVGHYQVFEKDNRVRNMVLSGRNTLLPSVLQGAFVVNRFGHSVACSSTFFTGLLGFIPYTVGFQTFKKTARDKKKPTDLIDRITSVYFMAKVLQILVKNSQGLMYAFAFVRQIHPVAISSAYLRQDNFIDTDPIEMITSHHWSLDYCGAYLKSMPTRSSPPPKTEEMLLDYISAWSSVSIDTKISAFSKVEGAIWTEWIVRIFTRYQSSISSLPIASIHLPKLNFLTGVFKQTLYTVHHLTVRHNEIRTHIRSSSPS